MSVGFVAAVILSAFITGGLARFALPGPDPMPIWLTIGIGLVGSIVGAVVGDQLTNGNGAAVSFVSFALRSPWSRSIACSCRSGRSSGRTH